MKVTIPELCLVVLVGTSGSGKSTFARRHFKPTEVLSSDYCRGIVSDDETDQSCTNDAFDVLHYIAAKRLSAGKVVVIDATNVQPQDRKALVELARNHNVFAVAVVLNVPESICHERNQGRPDRDFGPHVVRRQRAALRKSLGGLQREGFRFVHILSPEDIEQAELERIPLWTNKKDVQGPFDIIGDVHGCYDELQQLLLKLGYQFGASENGIESAIHPEGRKAVFVGDLVDRGPHTPAVLRLVMEMVRTGAAYCVAGNHDAKLMRKLKGRDVKMTHGLQESMDQLESEPDTFKQEIVRFTDSLLSHYQFDGGKLVVAHAGLKQAFQGRTSKAVREFALYGESTGETDEYGLPVRYPWAQDYRGSAMVVYGHTPVREPEWINKTICIDTGCVFGGKLTALRYPELQLISVDAGKVYYEPAKPFLTPDADGGAPDERTGSDLLDINDVIGKRIISTKLRPTIHVREENAIAALEVMSRFAIDPRWLIYLPPTMSPSETSRLPGYLEHPSGAFDYYREQNVPIVMCQEKHMGSRAVVIVCRDAESARRKFGWANASAGVCYTRTGRQFFHDEVLEMQFMQQVRNAVSASEIWDELQTEWLVLDCELMPWSAKAQELLRQQYAAVGVAATVSMAQAVEHLSLAAARVGEAQPLLAQMQERQRMVAQYREAYRRYCWKVESLRDLKLAPFHVLASEGAVHFDKDHRWHMQMAARLAKADSNQLLMATNFREIVLADEQSVQSGVDWWHELTDRGGEGMVVKPIDFVVTGQRGLVQPAVKCRGREYLRIIYGPEYDLPENIERLRARGLAGKRSLAQREFALGLEGLERFVKHEPLYRVHECAFAVLALESEPVDPRL